MRKFDKYCVMVALLFSFIAEFFIIIVSIYIPSFFIVFIIPILYFTIIPMVYLIFNHLYVTNCAFTDLIDGCGKEIKPYKFLKFILFPSINREEYVKVDTVMIKNKNNEYDLHEIYICKECFEKHNALKTMKILCNEYDSEKHYKKNFK